MTRSSPSTLSTLAEESTIVAPGRAAAIIGSVKVKTRLHLSRATFPGARPRGFDGLLGEAPPSGSGSIAGEGFWGEAVAAGVAAPVPPEPDGAAWLPQAVSKSTLESRAGRAMAALP
jgi:hypothetical protein